jgi:hypothetical protein
MKNPTDVRFETAERSLEAKTTGRGTRVVNMLPWKPGTAQKGDAAKFANVETASGITLRRSTV